MLSWETFSKTTNIDSIEAHTRFLQLTAGMSDDEIRSSVGKPITFKLGSTVYTGVVLNIEEVAGSVQSFSITVEDDTIVQIMEANKINGRFYMDGELFVVDRIKSPPRLRRTRGMVDDDVYDVDTEAESVMTELDDYVSPPASAVPISLARQKLRALAAEAQAAGYRPASPPRFIPPRAWTAADIPSPRPMSDVSQELVYEAHPELRPQPLLLEKTETEKILEKYFEEK